MLSDIPQHLIVFISLRKLESENKNFTIFPITPITFQDKRWKTVVYSSGQWTSSTTAFQHHQIQSNLISLLPNAIKDQAKINPLETKLQNYQTLSSHHSKEALPPVLFYNISINSKHGSHGYNRLVTEIDLLAPKQKQRKKKFLCFCTKV